MSSKKNDKLRNNILIYSSLAVLLIVLLWGFGVFNAELVGCTLDNQNLVCNAVRESGWLRSFLGFSIYLTPTTAQPGQTVTVGMEMMIPYTNQGICDGLVTVNNQEYSFAFQLFGVTACMPNGGCSVGIDTTITAPSQVGTYPVVYQILSCVESVVVEESTNLLVQNQNNQCPSAYCSDWSFVISDSHGDIYRRSCYTYGTPPTCTQHTETEYMTDCDAGYVCEGFQTNTCSEQHNCVLPSNPTTTLYTTTTTYGVTTTLHTTTTTLPPSCTTVRLCTQDSECPAISGHIVSCADSGFCQCDGNPPPTCKAYQYLTETGCAFSISSLFTSNGFEQFYSDNKTAVIIGVAAFFAAIIGLIIYNNRGGGRK